MNFTLKVWRQRNAQAPGKLETYEARDIPSDASFLEMIDIVNSGLEEKGLEPIAFQHDCREGICGSCAMMINGAAHGPVKGAAACQLHMRSFRDGDEIVVEPWRSVAFPIVKDLVVDRAALDRVIQAGGFISAPTGGARDANEILVPKEDSDAAMDAAACIGCGACIAACPNGSASLFTGAKISHLAHLPQDGRGALRPLHALRRVPGGVPEDDLDRRDRRHEPRLHEGDAHAPRGARGDRPRLSVPSARPDAPAVPRARRGRCLPSCVSADAATCPVRRSPSVRSGEFGAEPHNAKDAKATKRN
ncbi:MAG: succinate dehydrogenase/fumarate reductase iron-sulfur subunit [Gemmatimonadaceae bacterium]|nr:succinate dehydrogenase/fumarate reductase iron-sulfur subunit [Gemmatimonadaceae bacterium]